MGIYGIPLALDLAALLLEIYCQKVISHLLSMWTRQLVKLQGSALITMTTGMTGDSFLPAKGLFWVINRHQGAESF